ncbi:NfeD family protein [Silanimonas lenta]|uniref:NfeD family protein n=1 Tax=Silanimonas lenta TaxID=265429 RepID=UPI003D0DFFA4
MGDLFDFRPVVIFWACLALGLIALETLVPGAALIWLGLAAGAMLLLVVFVPDLPVFWQAVLFVLLSFAIVYVYWRRLRRTGIATTQPLLNRRAAQLVGQVHVLERAIENGRGRIRIGDAFWQVEGPDLPEGTRVRIVGVVSTVLQVEAA